MKEGHRGFFSRFNPKELVDHFPRPCLSCGHFYAPYSKRLQNEDFTGTCSTCDVEIYGSALYIKYVEEGRELEEKGMLFEPFYDNPGREDVSAHVRLPNGRKSKMLFITRETIEERQFGFNGERQQYARVRVILIEQNAALVNIRNSLIGEEEQTVLVDRRQLLEIA
ncbi:MAG: hypothetical protein A3B44_03785 [Candidatus Levybacteria bacterium RIFCSPLOWO2_01_FULL_38_21]|nr:MAG: hypothetical protein A3B44_03785 [Candidatus Levybacteria bacterium RIFCSPLOWO2_01_FULL_38_21]